MILIEMFFFLFKGDWIFVVDHPCEFLTQLFMTMKRNHNNDQFLKIKEQ
jgi:hypothetical protein